MCSQDRYNCSYLGQLGVLLTPAGNLMGLEWRMLTALFASMLSKEAALATMGVMYSESKSFKLVIGMVAYMGFLSFALAILSYQILRFFM